MRRQAVLGEVRRQIQRHVKTRGDPGVQREHTVGRGFVVLLADQFDVPGVEVPVPAGEIDGGRGPGREGQQETSRVVAQPQFAPHPLRHVGVAVNDVFDVIGQFQALPAGPEVEFLARQLVGGIGGQHKGVERAVAAIPAGRTEFGPRPDRRAGGEGVTAVHGERDGLLQDVGGQDVYLLGVQFLPVDTGPLLHRAVVQTDHEAVIALRSDRPGRHSCDRAAPADTIEFRPGRTGPLLHRAVVQTDHETVGEGQYLLHTAAPVETLELFPLRAGPLLDRSITQTDDEPVPEGKDGLRCAAPAQTLEFLPLRAGPLLDRPVAQTDHEPVAEGDRRADRAAPDRILHLVPLAAVPMLHRSVGQAQDEAVTVGQHRLDVRLTG